MLIAFGIGRTGGEPDRSAAEPQRSVRAAEGSFGDVVRAIFRPDRGDRRHARRLRSSDSNESQMDQPESS